MEVVELDFNQENLVKAGDSRQREVLVYVGYRTCDERGLSAFSNAA